MTISMNQDLTSVSEMKLIIKIKETVEEVRELTTEEQCMYSVTITSYYDKQLRDSAGKKLSKVGFINILSSDNKDKPNEGLFRHEIIRDATFNERAAHHYLQIVGDDNCKASFKKCENCITTDINFSGGCIASKTLRQEAQDILKGKEVILELL